MVAVLIWEPSWICKLFSILNFIQTILINKNTDLHKYGLFNQLVDNKLNHAKNLVLFLFTMSVSNIYSDGPSIGHLTCNE